MNFNIFNLDFEAIYVSGTKLGCILPVWLAMVDSESPSAAKDVSGWSHISVKLFSLSLSQLDFIESNSKSLRGSCILRLKL